MHDHFDRNLMLMIKSLAITLMLPLACRSQPTGFVRTSAPYSVNQTNFLALGLGVSWHFNMATYEGVELAAPTTPGTFCPPSQVNLTSWMTTAKSYGAKYVVLTTKHWDGFALWPTSYNYPTATNPANRVPYSTAQSSCFLANNSADFVGSFIAAAQAQGLQVALYYCIRDGTFLQNVGTTADNTAAYISMVETQLQELLTRYGSITALLTDGWGWCTDVGGGYPARYPLIPYSTISEFVHRLQPGILLIENNHVSRDTDLSIYESQVDFAPAAGNAVLSQFWPTTGMSAAQDGTDVWFTNPKCYIQPLFRLGMDLRNGSANQYSTLINLGPDATGNLTACESAALAKAAAIRATAPPSLGAPVAVSGTYSPSTCAAVSLTDGIFPNLPHFQAVPLWCSEAGDQNPWAEIDLGVPIAISEISVWNRYDGIGDGRMRDITITACNTSPCSGGNAIYTSATLNPANILGGGNSDYSNGPRYVMAQGLSLAARYVRVTRAGTDATDNGCQLSITEIGIVQ